MDEYSAYAAELETDIQRLRRLRDAQVSGSERADQFQAQIDLLTDRFTDLGRRAPALRDLDQQVADVEDRRDRVAVEVAWRGGLGMRFKWLGATAGALALAVLGVASGWPWVAVLATALVGAGCGVRSWAARNLREQAADELAALDRDLEGLWERRCALRNTGMVLEVS